MEKPKRRWLEKLQNELSATEDHFSSLFPPTIPPWPIPFFGDSREAVVLTVGVNPSAGEFADGRWAGVASLAKLEERLFSYFHCNIPPHPWFETWESALNKVDASYYGSEKHLAAHVDLSPRATVKIKSAQEDLFFDLVRNDLFSFIRFIKAAKKCRILLLAGAVCSECYAVEMLKEH